MRNSAKLLREDDSLAENLIVFYDEFLEFQGYCALLCDAMSCMAMTEMGRMMRLNEVFIPSPVI